MIDRVAWDDARKMLKRHVRVGDHLVAIGSTGSGKSVAMREIVPLLGGNIVIFDGKGGDDPNLDWPGFRTITDWPPREAGALFRAMRPEQARRPVRVRLAPVMAAMKDLAQARRIFHRALDDLFTRRGSKVYSAYFDEMGIMADPRKMGLGQKIEVMLQQMRYRPASVVSSMQFPTWLPKPAYRETTHRLVFKIHDEDSLKFLASITGRRAEVLPALEGLRRHEFLWQDIRSGRLIVSKVDLRP